MKRILLYVHFNKFNQVSDHVIYQLKHMKPLFSKIIFISNSPLNDDDKVTLQERLGIQDIIERKNIGFDFSAWRDGMSQIGFDHLADYDSVTLMNDTCFGPLWDVEEIYRYFEEDSIADFWGMTNFRKTKYFEEHLQSYFVTFKRSILQSQIFQDFWSQIKDYVLVQEVIDRYETKFTTIFQKAGFHYEALFDTRSVVDEGLLHPDFSYYRPLEILDRNVPFLKVKAIEGNPFLVKYLFKQLEEQSHYPLDLIKRHMFAYFTPVAPYLLEDSYLSLASEAKQIAQPILLHIHVTEPAILKDYSQQLCSLPLSYDFLLTAPNLEILEQAFLLFVGTERKITKALSHKSSPLFALLEQKELVANYSYIGHLSTHTLVEQNPLFDNIIRRELFQSMLDYAAASVEELETNDMIGLVIPDVPSPVADGLLEQVVDSEQLSRLWQQLGCRKPYDFTKQSNFAKVYGGFFWSKSTILTPLFELEKEKWRGYSDKELSNLMEWLLLYLAWDQDYDFKILPAVSPRPALVELQLRQQALKELEEKSTQKNVTQKILTRLAILLKLK